MNQVLTVVEINEKQQQQTLNVNQSSVYMCSCLFVHDVHFEKQIENIHTTEAFYLHNIFLSVCQYLDYSSNKQTNKEIKKTNKSQGH